MNRAWTPDERSAVSDLILEQARKDARMVISALMGATLNKLGGETHEQLRAIVWLCWVKELTAFMSDPKNLADMIKGGATAMAMDPNFAKQANEIRDALRAWLFEEQKP